MPWEAILSPTWITDVTWELRVNLNSYCYWAASTSMGLAIYLFRGADYTQVSCYITINLLPLSLLKRKMVAWKNVPLFLIGRVNLIKMKILPAFVYFLHRALVWVPRSFFKKIQTTLFGEFPPLGFHSQALQELWGQRGPP